MEEKEEGSDRFVEENQGMKGSQPIPSLQGAGKVVLTRLGRLGATGGDLLPPEIFGVEGQECLPKPAELAATVVEDRAVGADR